jgi:hypothetical protein
MWRVSTLATAAGPPVPLGGGRFIQVEGDQLVMRDAETGAALGSVTAPSVSWVTPDPWGGFVFSQSVPGGSATLRRLGADGSPVWSVPLGGSARLLLPPVALADAVVVVHDNIVRVIDREGRVVGVVGRDGFRDPTAPPPHAEPDTVWLWPRRVGRTAVLLGLRWSTVANRLFVADLGTRSVVPYAEWLVPSQPVEVLPQLAGGFRVALRGPSTEVRKLEWQHSVVVLDPAGRQLWEHRMPAEPAALTAGTAGSLIAAATPSRTRWEQYHQWQDLSSETFVRCLDPDATIRWTWSPPSWISHHPVVGPDGVVYVGSAGTLWALAP